MTKIYVLAVSHPCAVSGVELDDLLSAPACFATLEGAKAAALSDFINPILADEGIPPKGSLEWVNESEDFGGLFPAQVQWGYESSWTGHVFRITEVELGA